MDRFGKIKRLLMQTGVVMGYMTIAGFCATIGYLAVIVLSDVKAPPAQTVTASAYDPISPITSVMPQMQPVLPLALAPISEIMQAGAYTPPAQNQ